MCIYLITCCSRKGESYKLSVLSFVLCCFPSRGFYMQCSQFASLNVTRMGQHEGSRDELRFSTAFTA